MAKKETQVESVQVENIPVLTHPAYSIVKKDGTASVVKIDFNLETGEVDVNKISSATNNISVAQGSETPKKSGYNKETDN